MSYIYDYHGEKTKKFPEEGPAKNKKNDNKTHAYRIDSSRWPVSFKISHVVYN
jgi:hypothetical protein